MIVALLTARSRSSLGSSTTTATATCTAATATDLRLCRAGHRHAVDGDGVAARSAADIGTHAAFTDPDDRALVGAGDGFSKCALRAVASGIGLHRDHFLVIDHFLIAFAEACSN